VAVVIVEHHRVGRLFRPRAGGTNGMSVLHGLAKVKGLESRLSDAKRPNPHCEQQRSNPDEGSQNLCLDCFVAALPRNDGLPFRSTPAPARVRRAATSKRASGRIEKPRKLSAIGRRP
jgi:hypothetical protein